VAQALDGSGEDAGVHFAHLALFRRGVLLFDDARHLAGGIAQDAAVAGGVGHIDREQGQPFFAGGAHQALQGRHADQRHVAIQDQGRVAVLDQRHGLLHRMTSALGRILAGPGEIGRIEGFAHHFTPVAIDHDDAPGLQRTGRIEHMGQHRLGSQRLENLGQHRAHAFALAGGENDHFHGHPLMRFECILADFSTSIFQAFATQFSL
jgi:hypothetical protein